MRRLAGSLAVCIFMAFPAAAQMLCRTRADIINALEKDYEERKTASGLSDGGVLIEVFTSERKTWTLLFTVPGGPTCVLSGGDNWESVPPAKPGRES